MMGAWIRRAARRDPSGDALVCGTNRDSWGEFNARVNQLANGLLAYGIHKGDRIGVYLRNCREFVEIYGAAAKIGAIVVPLNAWLREEELSYVVNHAEPRLLFFSGQSAEAISSARPGWHSVEQVLAVGAPAADATYEAFLRDDVSEPKCPDVDCHDGFMLLYTSGTTGRPKGALLTHNNLRVQVLDFMYHYGLDDQSVALVMQPLFFSAPLYTLVLPMWYLGRTLVLLEQFDPDFVMDAIEHEHVTHLQMVPIMIRRTLEASTFRHRDLSSLRLIGYGSAPIDPVLLKEALDAFPSVGFAQGYGTTESGVATILRPEDHDPEVPARLLSCGRSTLNAEFKLVDGDFAEVPVGDVGEIVMRGESVSPLYWNDARATVASRQDGWFRTGDLGRLDDAGFLYIVGRTHDMIVSGAVNIYPKEIEDVISRYPAVREAAVIGVPNSEWGEAVCAYVILREDHELDPDDLLKYCRRHLATYKVPKSLEIVEDLPRTATGKILKRSLREAAWAGVGRQVG